MIYDSRKITCPKCQAVLEVPNPKKLMVRDITCPNPACKSILHVKFYDGETMMAQKRGRSGSPGYLEHRGQSPMQLKEGVNTVGRADKKHSADIEIDTDDVAMSRVHCQIEVIRLKDNTVKAIIRDIRDKEKIKQMPTLLNDEALAYVDQIVLDDGDQIQMGRTTISYMQEKRRTDED